MTKLLYRISLFFISLRRIEKKLLILGIVALIASLIYVIISLLNPKDYDKYRGAIGIEGGAYNEIYTTPMYLDQGWDENDSLWFYNTTQGSALLPYSFLLYLEQPGANKDLYECERNNEEKAWFLCPKHIDKYRYLPQEATNFNKDALPVGFVKDHYQGKEYIGFTCAACHTGQINFKGDAIRIDGGPTTADIDGFLKKLALALDETSIEYSDKNKTFIANITQKGDFKNNPRLAQKELIRWTKKIQQYNQINYSKTKYGYARLDAFGRIYNRVLQYSMSKKQLEQTLSTIKRSNHKDPLFDEIQIKWLLDDIGNEKNVVMSDADFSAFLDKLNNLNTEKTITKTDLLRVRNALFNPPNAPVSYPFLWDISHSDFVQWNGLAGNSFLSPLGRNVGEVIGVFGILDWHSQKRNLTIPFTDHPIPILSNFDTFLSRKLTGQQTTSEVINFKSSVNKFNLERIEHHLQSLNSPKWPFCKEDANSEEYSLPKSKSDKTIDNIDCKEEGKIRYNNEKVVRGKELYVENCLGCHVIINRKDPHRKMISKMSGIGLDKIQAVKLAKNLKEDERKDLLELITLSTPLKNKELINTLELAEDRIKILSENSGTNTQKNHDNNTSEFERKINESSSFALNELVRHVKNLKECEHDNSIKCIDESTDETMALNSVMYKGLSGNFKDTYQKTDVGYLVIEEEAPVIQILTAATTGVVTQGDPDKWWPRRIIDWLYTTAATYWHNPVVKGTVKSGDYTPDTTANPYNSLLSYRARSLNGIWATAPYLHNGSVPTLYDLLLCDEKRPKTFKVGTREFDPVKVGIKASKEGFTFDTSIPGNSNKGHNYGACKFSEEDRYALIEYLKTL